ncbi:MAG: glycoside hydrolase 43 family protein [bacterium]|nr:glycoside hydrolase 43 family protein [bacterium]MDI1335340.1 glycoside hydrolase 43 family protein [Lacunisphaera sp.]
MHNFLRGRLALGFVLAMSVSHSRATEPAAWSPDLGDGTYQNPIIHADYSDPDAVRVGDDYWMTSSSFSHVPGLPILHSRDLVNWGLVGHALPRLVPEDAFRTPQHGKGVWAPAIRFHDGKYWIYYPDPDFGIYLVTAADPRGPWSAPVLVKGGKGLIDPCPLWDDDGRVYLVHGWAKSRSGINNKLTLLRLSADATKVEEDFGFIIDGDKLPGYTTLEGPKLYKRNGWYYVFAPAGGVAPGWQSVFRSKNIRGPYEDRIVLAQGASPINGPHQGALVDTPSGQWWFLHFQDKDAYGRIVHLQPVAWHDDWPYLGTGATTNAVKGEPVLTYRKPNVGPALVAMPPTGDEFDAPALGVQWQWQANPSADWLSLTAKPGALRLFAQPAPKLGNLYDAPFLLLQKFPAPEFSVTTKLEFAPKADGDSAGLIVFGYDYAWIGLKRIDGAPSVVVARRTEAVKGAPQVETPIPVKVSGPVWLRVTVREGGKCRFSYSLDGAKFAPLGEGDFTATVGRWVGAKVGLFASGTTGLAADFDFFRVGPPTK